MDVTGTEALDRPKGPRFTKLYERGFDRLDQLLALKGGPTVGKLWLFLARHCGHDNALSATIDVLAEELGCSEKSIRNATKFLAASGALVVLKMGTANVYVMNDNEIWKTYEEHKHFCSFSARTLVSKRQNADMKKRLTHMVGEPKE